MCNKLRQTLLYPTFCSWTYLILLDIDRRNTTSDLQGCFNDLSSCAFTYRTAHTYNISQRFIREWAYAFVGSKETYCKIVLNLQSIQKPTDKHIPKQKYTNVSLYTQ